MELKAGYKQTEVGVIPEDWDVRLLQEFGDLTSSKRIFESDYVESGVPFYRGKEISTLILNKALRDEHFISDSRYEQIRSQFGAPVKGDILITAVGTLGNIYLVPDNQRFYFKDGNLIWLRNVRDVVHRYLAIQLGNRKKAIIDSAIGSSQKALTIVTLNQTLIATPPTKAEQEAIAEALSDADTLIESLDQLIAKKRDLKQGAMQQLFVSKVGWHTEKLEDISDVIDPHPSHRAPPIASNGIPFVGIGDLNEDGDLIGNNIRTVAESVLDEHKLRYDLNEELIGLGRVASIGKVVKLKPAGVRYTISPTLGIIRGTKIRRDYLLYALRSRDVSDQFNRILSGSTRSSVGMIVLRKLDIAMPATESEQTAIATILSDMDAEIAELESRLAKARQIKQGMMQELLTGRIRLL